MRLSYPPQIEFAVVAARLIQSLLTLNYLNRKAVQQLFYGTVAPRRRPRPRPPAFALRLRDWPRPRVARPPAAARRSSPAFFIWRTT